MKYSDGVNPYTFEFRTGYIRVEHKNGTHVQSVCVGDYFNPREHLRPFAVGWLANRGREELK